MPHLAGRNLNLSAGIAAKKRTIPMFVRHSGKQLLMQGSSYVPKYPIGSSGLFSVFDHARVIGHPKTTCRQFWKLDISEVARYDRAEPFES